MDNPHLRPIFVNLRERLSDNDQKKLDIYLRNNGRPIENNSTLIWTLRFIQLLFDRDKINNKDFDLLIDAFKQIQCFDAVNRLEHQRQVRSDSVNESSNSLASVMPPHIYILPNNNDREDPYVTMSFIENRVDYRNSSDYDTIGGEDTTTNEYVSKRPPSRKLGFYVRLLKNKYFILSSILLLLTLGALVIVLIERYNQSNQTVNQLTYQLLEKDVTIEQLNGTLMNIQRKRNITLIIPGKKFGSDRGDDFDDSLLPNFNSSHYLSGIRSSEVDDFITCQFLYRSSPTSESQIESDVYGNNRRYTDLSSEYELDDGERIKEVQVESGEIESSYYDDYLVPLTLIKRFRFITTRDRIIPPDIDVTDNDVEKESFPGYTLGYVTGKSSAKIYQLQFFWYRTEQ